MQQLPLEMVPPAQPGFDNYVAGANAEALEGVRRLAAGELREAVLYLWGPRGSGRTHLLAAASRANPRLVIADDVETLDPGERQALFVAINAARDASGPAVLAAGGSAPARLALREDLRTRLAWGLVYQLQPLSDADKAAHLRSQAERRGLRLGEEVLEYLLTRLPRDMSTLLAVLEVLDRYSLVRQRALTLPLVREALAAAQQRAELPRQTRLP